MKKITSTDELKKVQIDILLYIDKICKKNKIKYFLAYGALLGSIRHKGFIPWDDDIDITMPRLDYERFIKVMKTNKGIYRLVCLENCKKDYSYPFAKVCDARTIINEPWRPMKEEIGVYVDIFPLDGLGDTEKNAKENAKKLLKITKQIWFMETVKNQNIKGRILNFIGRKNLNKYFKYIAKKNNYYKSKYVGMLAWPSDHIEYIEQKYYLEMISGDFEGNSFPIPKYYDAILNNRYGDYMTFPPLDKRKRHHPFEAWWK